MNHPYVIPRKGSINLYYHRQIPLALRAILGRAQYWKSLNTPKRREAYRRAAAVSVEFNKMIADAEAALALTERTENMAKDFVAACDSGDFGAATRAVEQAPEPFIPGAPGPSVLDENAVPVLAQRFTVFSLQTDDDERVGLSDADIFARRAEMENAQEQLSLAGAADRYEQMKESADALLEAENMTADLNSEAYQLLLKALLDADLTVIAEQVGRLRGRRAPSPKAIPPIPAECDNWPAMLSAWKKKRNPREKTYDETKRLTERFQELTGNPPIHQIDADHVEGFKARLLHDGLSPSRINTILALLRAVVFAAMKEEVTTLESNPFSGVQFSEKAVNEVPPAKPREPFRVEELNVLFSSPVYKETLRPAKGGREAAFWLPLLGLFCGAREEDIGCLATGDFRSFDGIWYVELGDNKSSNGSTRRSVYRKVPLHVELIKLGLLRYVEKRTKEVSGKLDAPLFPDLISDGYGNRTKVFGAWFNEYIDKLGLSDPRLDFHALRATFQDFAELSGLLGINPDIIDHIVGHKPDMSRMSNHYGRKDRRRKVPPFAHLVEAMKLFRIPGLELSHLYVR